MLDTEIQNRIANYHKFEDIVKIFVTMSEPSQDSTLCYLYDHYLTEEQREVFLRMLMLVKANHKDVV